MVEPAQPVVRYHSKPAGQYTLIREDKDLEMKGQRLKKTKIQIENKQKELDQILRDNTRPEIEELKKAQERFEEARKEFVAKQQKLMQKAKLVSETNQEFKKKHHEYETFASVISEQEEEFRRDATRYISETQRIIDKDKTLSDREKRRAMRDVLRHVRDLATTPSEAAFIDKITEQLGKGEGIIVISAARAPERAAAAFEGPADLFLL
jgi:phosphoenolpyruvate-protein kinase (PTS system EI component)